MASELKDLKIGKETLAEHLEALDVIANPDHLFCYSYNPTAHFRDALRGQPFDILNRLYENEAFKTWLLKASKFISSLFSNPGIFNIGLQEKIQPLVDLLYYFNKIDPIIENSLFKLEVIKQIALRKLASFEENYKLSFGENITYEELCKNIEPVDVTVKTLFESYTGISEKTPASRIEQACSAAWLIYRIKGNPAFKGLNTYDNLIGYLNDLLKQYFSPSVIQQTYSRHAPGNRSLANLFYRVNAQVEYKINMINNPPHPNPEQLNQAYLNFFYMPLRNATIDLKQTFFEQRNPAYLEIFDSSMTDGKKVDLKILFLKLFENHTSHFPFFGEPASNPDLKNLCATVRKMEQTSVDWGFILQQLLELAAQIDTPKMNAPKAREDSLSERTAFFSEILAITGARVFIPDLRNLNPPAAEMKCSSGPSSTGSSSSSSLKK